MASFKVIVSVAVLVACAIAVQAQEQPSGVEQPKVPAAGVAVNPEEEHARAKKFAVFSPYAAYAYHVPAAVPVATSYAYTYQKAVPYAYSAAYYPAAYHYPYVY